MKKKTVAVICDKKHKKSTVEFTLLNLYLEKWIDS